MHPNQAYELIKQEIEVMRANMMVAEMALKEADEQMDYYHGYPMRPEILEPKSWEDVHLKVKQARALICSSLK